MGVPPPSAWGQFVELKNQHMMRSLCRPPYPGIVLLPVFVSPRYLAEAAGEMAHILSSTPPFEITFTGFKTSEHDPRDLYLETCCEPPSALTKLQNAIAALAPQSHYKFDMHIEMGTFGACSTADQHRITYGESWNPLRFTVQHVLLLKLTDPTSYIESWTVVHAVPLEGVPEDAPPPLEIGSRTSLLEQLPDNHTKRKKVCSICSGIEEECQVAGLG